MRSHSYGERCPECSALLRPKTEAAPDHSDRLWRWPLRALMIHTVPWLFLGFEFVIGMQGWASYCLIIGIDFPILFVMNGPDPLWLVFVLGSILWAGAGFGLAVVSWKRSE